ncbi:hypothetical protein [Anaerotignum sp.]|uniref:hypothetical protein n=1 Tax=Anaerotignum sp. TaxID=2039241 RepID=UPI0028AC4A2D|nr:hypothetical protein [Anaerotignum sp.]
MSSKVKELQKLNNQLDKKINAENQTIFTDMICYIRSANISDYNQEVVRRDLSEMILSAQERGEDIHGVIGGDFKEFCDEVIENLPPKTTKEKICDGLDIICTSIAILGAINIFFSKDLYRIVEQILSKQSVNYNIGIPLGTIISSVIVTVAAVLIVNIITKNALNHSSSPNKLKRAVLGGAAGGGIMALFILIAKLGTKVVFSINIFLAISLLIVFFITHKLLNKI